MLEIIKNNRNNRKKLFFIVIFSVFTIVFLIQLYNIVDLEFLELVVTSINFVYLFFAFVLYLVVNLLRTYRFKKIYEDKISFVRMYEINSIHNFFNHIIPYRLGELSHLNMINNEKIDYSQSISNLVYLRVLDLIVSGQFLIVLTIFTIARFEKPEIYIISSCIIGFFVFIGLMIVFKSNYLIKLIDRIAKFLTRIKNDKINEKINKTSIFIKDFFKNIESKKKRNFRSFILITIILRIFQLSVIILVCKALNIELPIYVILINDSIMIYVTLIPLSLLAGLGFYEFSFSKLLEFQNIPLIDPYNIGLAIHLIMILFYVLIIFSSIFANYFFNKNH